MAPDDDNAATLRRRLAVYHERTATSSVLCGKRVLRSVEGMNSVDEVAAQIDAILG